MQLARTGVNNYVLLPSGVLIVEPDPGLLAYRAQLINAANQYAAASSEDMAGAELCRVELTVALLSETLGRKTLERLAQEIRVYWPNAFILIFGNATEMLEDWLYDDAVDEHCRPEQLLSILHGLRKNTQCKMQAPRLRRGPLPFGLFGTGRVLLHRVPPESDPSKANVAAVEEEPAGWSVPADEHAHA